MAEKDELQLLPGTKKRLGIKIPGENRFLYIGSAILGAVLITAFSLNSYTTSLKGQIKDLNDQLVALERTRNKQDEAQLRLTKDRLTLTANLVDNHVYYTQVFEWFEDMLQSEVQIDNMAVSNNGKLTFSAFAKSYTVVARQIAAFLADNRVTDMSVGSIDATSSGNVKFDMVLTLKLQDLLRKEK